MLCERLGRGHFYGLLTRKRSFRWHADAVRGTVHSITVIPRNSKHIAPDLASCQVQDPATREIADRLAGAADAEARRAR